MKQLTRSLLCILLLSGAATVKGDDCNSGCSNGFSNNNCSNNCSVASDCSTNCSSLSGCGTCHSALMPRSVNDNLARRLEEHYGHRFDADCFNGGATLILEYQRSFKGDRLAECLFGGTNTLNFIGSDNLPTATICGRTLIGDNFGISPFARTSVSFKPRIDNINLDFNFYFGFDEWCNGVFFQLRTPLVHSRWRLEPTCNGTCVENTGCSNGSGCSTGCSNNFSNNCSTSGCFNNCSNGSFSNCNASCDVLSSCTLVTTPFPAGCVAPISSGTIGTAADIATALSGDFTFGQMQTPWQWGRFKFCTQDDTKLSDIDLILGYDFWECEDYHVGLFIRAVAPTGTRIDSCWARNFFSPVIGNGRHWELGGGLTAHAELWNCNDDHVITAYLEGNVTHMFRNCQVRSFDFLNNGCFSRYMLLKEFVTSTAGVTTYNNALINAINFTTRRANVSIDVKGEATLKFVYRHCGWSLGVGYDIYGRSRENVCIKTGFLDDALTGRRFGIKGCSPVQAQCYTIAAGTSGILTLTTPTTLVSTESNATISSCGPVDNGVLLLTPAGAETTGSVCFNTCAPLPTIVSGETTLTTALANGAQIAQNSLVSGANAPVLLSGDPSELSAASGAMPRQLTHKIYGTIEKEWSDCDWTPYIGIGGEGEFAAHQDCCSIQQWGVWIKGGISY